MNYQEITERANRIAALMYPGVPVRAVCSWEYVRQHDDGRYEYRCTVCGDSQIVDQMIGATKTRACRGMTTRETNDLTARENGVPIQNRKIVYPLEHPIDSGSA